ncbi:MULTISPECIES: carbohydrate ABC transporter permease [unclassified Streptomyces]|uniref:carbohydrate ABC transporter permease n=1 Tax=unclassified Streptomyces TaxID=2593676 RepID=UPI0009393664|nr:MULTISPECIES: carbohydrate ABC transporter permease [unclassified Streptomyces]OKK09824.1 ABC transporter permease [Streptomyces sp. CB02488]WRZ09285.1 carbohydrate ABC transporter permease [Streptomyces sp. NBC_00341]WRZ09476.1 carbohydrate ABC transporter permease [Streptomyces sp. NBC_00341]
MTTLSPAHPVRRRPRRSYSAIPGETPGSLPWRTLKSLILLICVVLVLLPFLAIISTSLADTGQVTRAGGYVLWPDNPSWSAYSALLSGGLVSKAMLVSVGITVVGTALSLVCSIMLAYGLSRPGSFGHRPVLIMLLMTMLFAPGVIPSYLMVKQLGLINSYWSLILPTMINAFNVIVLRSFFMSIPKELLDSARIDGASETTILTRIVLPLSKAAVAVIGLFYAVTYWNAFFNALLYINDASKWPMQLVLRTYVVNNAALSGGQVDVAAGAPLPPAQSLQAAILVLSIVPIVIVYPFLQRHMNKGVMVGAVKG